MNELFRNELKKEFQIERLILFSDAVFAIAITILVIEIKVPVIDEKKVTDAQLGHALLEMIPKFVGFLISFFIIGLFWTIHHRMFGYVVNYTQRLLWLNLLFLLAVVLMPFSTAFYSEYIRFLKNTPVIVYVSNIVFLGVMNITIWRYINNPKLNLVEGVSSQLKKYFSIRAIMAPVIFVLMAIVYLTVSPLYAVWIPLLIPVLLRIFKLIYFKRK